MEEIIPCSLKDQEVFQRVWQRVMAGRDESGSPLKTLPADLQGDLSCECLEALLRQENGDVPPACERQSAREAPIQDTSAPEAPAEEPPAQEQPPAQGEALPSADSPHRDSDLPQLWEEPQPVDDRTARLRRQVMEALEGWQFYRHLARKARAADARVLNGMAGELHRHARKLSAAYFLLTGLRYWPSELLATPAIPSYWGALRTRHQAEQRQETAYRTAADDWDDSDLLELYGELTGACQRRCRQLRTLLEQDMS